jgi:7-cyano-7-deazaguanine synthase in queuosine biosynthesis
MSKRIVVLMSGGLDSCVVATQACKMLDNDGCASFVF